MIYGQTVDKWDMVAVTLVSNVLHVKCILEMTELMLKFPFYSLRKHICCQTMWCFSDEKTYKYEMTAYI